MNLLREIKELIISLIYSTIYTYKNQWFKIRSHKISSFILSVKESFHIYMQWLKFYRRFLLVINILALLN